MADQPIQDATVSMITANLMALALVPIAALLFLLPYGLIWGSVVAELSGLLDRAAWGTAVLIFFLSIIVHELLHAVGYIWVGGVPRTAVALPGLTLGLLPALVGLFIGAFWLTLFGTLMVMTAGGDIAVLLAIRHLPPATIVRDHPTKVGCEVLSKP